MLQEAPGVCLILFDKRQPLTEADKKAAAAKP